MKNVNCLARNMLTAESKRKDLEAVSFFQP